jgi:hypothetical protein
MTFLIFLGTFILKVHCSIRIGQIKYSSVVTNTSFISTSSSTCSDCLCNCLFGANQNNVTQPKCYGINCFPSNHSCQQIEQLWIQETDILFNSSSDQFITTISLNFCSCYSEQNILNTYANVTPISIAYPSPRYLTYNPNDDTLIVLGDTLISQYFVSNLTRFRNISVTILPLATCVDSTNIYISFSTNTSVNKYDMNMRFLQSVRRTIGTSSSTLYGLAKWKNQLFVTDQELSLIWSINVTTMSMSIYRNMTSYNFAPFNIAVFNNQLYVSQISSPIIYIYNLLSSSVQTMTFPNSISLYRLQMDPFCDRIWFGTDATAYTSVPVLGLGMNSTNVYQAYGSLAQSQTYKVEFDSNYSMYTVAINGNSFFKYQMSSITCGKN